LTIPPEIITEAVAASADVNIQHNAVKLILDINKQAQKHWDEIIVIITANVIMVQIFIKALNKK
jgi:hypothetical protein